MGNGAITKGTFSEQTSEGQRKILFDEIVCLRKELKQQVLDQEKSTKELKQQVLDQEKSTKEKYAFYQKRSELCDRRFVRLEKFQSKLVGGIAVTSFIIGILATLAARGGV